MTVATPAKPKSDGLSTLPDIELKKLLPKSYDYGKDQHLNNGLRRMRWINFIRRNVDFKPFKTVISKATTVKTPKPPKTITIQVSADAEVPLPKNYYFDNNKVERLMQEYKATSCTDVKKRNEIMKHAEELIRQIIRAHGLHNIYLGHEESSFSDLFQVAWVQIESMLYKYEPGKAKVFNLWSQVARTVILAHIKKDGRDRRNSGTYRDFVVRKGLSRSTMFERFLSEAREICRYHSDYLTLLDCLSEIYDEDHKPHESLICKLVERSVLPRQTVVGFFTMLRLHSFEFTDAPRNNKPLPHPLSFQGSDDDE